MNIIRKLIKQPKIKLAEEAYSGSKKYLFNLLLKVTPKAGCESFNVWIPFPRSFYYQSVKTAEFSPKPKIIEDSVGNKVAFFEVKNPEIDKEYLFTHSSKVEVKARNEKANGKLENYNQKDPDYKMFTQQDPYVSYKDQRIKKLAEKLRAQEENVEFIAKIFYEYVRDNLTYGGRTEGLYSSEDALNLDKVDCGGYDTLLGAMMRYVGIPARLVSGFLAGYSGEHYHAWLEFMDPEGNWIPADPSMENLRNDGRDFKTGGFGKIGNDRVVVSIGTDISLNGKKFPLLQIPFVESVPIRKVLVERNIEASHE